MREALTKMGTVTGRHKTDKDALAGLTVRDLGEAVTYEEAEVTFLCRKIYSADMLTRHMPVDIVEAFYTPEEPHTLYIGEVIDIIEKYIKRKTKMAPEKLRSLFLICITYFYC